MRFSIVCALLAALSVPPAAAAGASNYLNYQGVLRDENGSPRNGTFDMRFRFFDAPTLGNELLVNEHLAAGTGGVVVTGGLFNVALGSGLVADGSGPGSYLTVMDVVSQNYDVWLEIEVGGETLTPRAGVRSSAYAMNASRLQGMEPSAFLNTSGSTQEKTGLIVASGGVDFGPGTFDDLTSADVSTLTGGGNADALHTHALVSNANLLDSIDSSQFLRSDVSDTYTNGVLTMAPSTVLDVKGTLQLNGSALMDADGPDGAQALYFFNSGSPTGASIQWDDVNGRFHTTHGLFVNGILRTNAGATIGGSQVTVGTNGPDQDQLVAFYEDGNPQGEYLQWDDSDDMFHFSDDVRIGGNATVTGSSLTLGAIGAETNQSIFFYNSGLPTGESITWDDAQARFEVSDELAISGTLRTGSVATASVAYNTFGSGTPESADINASTDVHVTGDMEVGGEIYLSDSDWITTWGGTSGNTHISAGLVTGGNIAINGNRLFMDWAVSGNAWLSYDSPDPQFQLTKGLDIIGTMSADVKNFVQNHPTDKSLSVVYTTLEGPEASVFTRGSGRLDNGVATVKLDETFAWVAHPDLGLTATLTPKGEWSNLYVESITPTELVVRGTADAKPDAAFDFLVLGLRVGYEESPVVQPKSREALLPQVEQQRATLASRPDLVKHTPLARYQQISRDVTGRDVADLSKGAALRAAIGVQEGPPGTTSSGMNPPKAHRDADQATPATATATHPKAMPVDSPSGEAAPAVAAPRASFEDADGNLYARSFRPNSGGLDAVSPVVGDVVAGDVLAIDPSGRGVRRADFGGDATVVGIATGDPKAGRDGAVVVPFAVAGIVTCHADASRGAIRPGDLLVSSPEPGHAMRSTSPAPGTVLGKALEELPTGTGTIRVLVVLR